MPKRTVEVVGGHGGVGKTKRLFERWNNEQQEHKKIYCSHSHIFLIEQSKRIKGTYIRVQGFSRLCSRIKEPLILNLYKNRFPVEAICEECDVAKECAYHLQFEEMKKVKTIFYSSFGMINQPRT